MLQIKRGTSVLLADRMGKFLVSHFFCSPRATLPTYLHLATMDEKNKPALDRYLALDGLLGNSGNDRVTVLL